MTSLSEQCRVQQEITHVFGLEGVQMTKIFIQMTKIFIQISDILFVCKAEYFPFNAAKYLRHYFREFR